MAVRDPFGTNRRLAESILDRDPGPAVRTRLLRDVLQVPPDDGRLIRARQDLGESPPIRELAAEQRPDGSWGPFHSQDTRNKQKIPTTETGVTRAVALGLPADHPVLGRAAAYILSILRGDREFPDRPEKNDRWPTGVRLFLAATLAQIQPDHPILEQDIALWSKITRQTFDCGPYSEDDEARAHAELTGASVRGSYLRLLNRYQISILGAKPGVLPAEVEKRLLAWLWQRPEGIGYLSVLLASRPPLGNSGHMDRWLTSHELLDGAFPSWRTLASPAVDWLWSQRQEDGLWDFGPRPSRLEVLPLSETWRGPHRRYDWTTRVLTLLSGYYRSTRL